MNTVDTLLAQSSSHKIRTRYLGPVIKRIHRPESSKRVSSIDFTISSLRARTFILINPKWGALVDFITEYRHNWVYVVINGAERLPCTISVLLWWFFRFCLIIIWSLNGDKWLVEIRVKYTQTCARQGKYCDLERKLLGWVGEVLWSKQKKINSVCETNDTVRIKYVCSVIKLPVQY